MAYGFDTEAIIKKTLGKILGSIIIIILYTNFKSLYDYLVKLETTQEKELIVDVRSLHLSYKQQEITEVNWIHGLHYPADSITKVKSLLALKILININHININIMESVDQAKIK